MSEPPQSEATAERAQREADSLDKADNKDFMLTLKKYYEMKIIMMVLFVLSVASSKSAKSEVQTINEIQTARITNPSIEVRDAQSLTSLVAEVF